MNNRKGLLTLLNVCDDDDDDNDDDSDDDDDDDVLILLLTFQITSVEVWSGSSVLYRLRSSSSEWCSTSNDTVIYSEQWRSEGPAGPATAGEGGRGAKGARQGPARKKYSP